MIRLLTINCGGSDETYGSWSQRAENIARTVLEDGVDVVAAQAVDVDDASLGELVTRLPDHVHVASSAGSAFLSRLPIEATKSVPLSLRPDLEDTNERVLFQASLATEGRTVHVINAHFSWVDEQARDNVREALDHAASLDGDVLLAGDMNQLPDSPAMRTIAKAGWTDVWAKVRPDEGGETFESGKLWGRIDYVWSRGTLVDDNTAIDLVGGDGDQALSNHRGVLVEVGL